MTMFFYHYLGCYSTVFSQILVCCSWDSGLSVMCLWYLIRCREHGQMFNSKCHLKILIDEFLVTCYPYERSEKSHKQKSHKQFLYKFCRSIISKTERTIIFKFSQYLWHHPESWTSSFQCDHSTMTSSRRHFVLSRYHSYLHNHWSNWAHILSLTANRFSPRFWYVVAETILYKKHDIYSSFWWRHHSQIFD